jgi:hypothetical protein
MKNTNQLGLWMDDSVAYLIHYHKTFFQTIVHEFQTEEKNQP